MTKLKTDASLLQSCVSKSVPKIKTYVITVSEFFPKTHNKSGLPTGFIDKIGSKIKKHTIRGNYELWKKRIDENELDWDQYLDENGKEAFTDKIISFPTNFLIDEKGNVIQKNISLEELEILLKENLK